MLKNKIVIGILPTYYYSDTDPYGDNSHFVRMYEERVKECGAIAIGLLHNNLDIYKDMVDAYIWPGGSIITKDFYVIFDDILKNKKPLLGVCLGSQAIATYFNIMDDQKTQPYLSLMDVYDSNKLDNIYLKKLEGDILNLHRNIVLKDERSLNNAKHIIKIKKNSFMYDIYKKSEIEVVSLHSYSIARTPKNLLVSAKSKDNVIEAVEYHENNNHILGLQYHPEVINDYQPFIWLINNSYSKYYILVNKNNKIPDNINFKIVCYKSKYNKCISEENNLEEQTLYAFIKLKEKMKELGYEIDLQSGFRYYSSQERLYNEVLSKKGKTHADKYVAKPGYSEHETGLAVDICAKINGNWFVDFDPKLNLIYNQLHKYVSDYGFIIRYPKGKEKITGYGYEPWHLRYIGNVSIAKEINKKGISLEEYLNKK